jgi:hypothetical protein
LYESGLDDVLREIEPGYAERPAQHGDEPAELVVKRLLRQGARFIHYSVVLDRARVPRTILV